jgi:hypothetical protein
MLMPILVTLTPVALGMMLALAPGMRRASTGPWHRMILALATAVVLVLMLPHAFSELGWAALGVFLPALLVPVLIERLAGHRHGHDDHHEPAMDADLGLAGMLLHQVVEGAEIAALASSSPAWATTALALALHTVPLVGAVLHKSVLRGGARAGLGRGLALMAASALGLAIGFLAGEALHGLEPWVLAAAGGLVLHTMWHGWSDGSGHAHEHGPPGHEHP